MSPPLHRLLSIPHKRPKQSISSLLIKIWIKSTPSLFFMPWLVILDLSLRLHPPPMADNLARLLVRNFQADGIWIFACEAKQICPCETASWCVGQHASEIGMIMEAEAEEWRNDFCVLWCRIL